MGILKLFAGIIMVVMGINMLRINERGDWAQSTKKRHRV